MKYHKRLNVVEAEQIEIRRKVSVNISGSLTLTAETMADPGEWLVTGALGDKWLCGDDVFRRLYRADIPIAAGECTCCTRCPRPAETTGPQAELQMCWYCLRGHSA